MPREIEAYIGCVPCRTVLLRIEREPTGANGVFEHVRVALDPVGDPNATTCPDCGATLHRVGAPT